MRIATLYRYPVKGLSPERIARAALSEGAHFPGDRIFAIENGPSGFDPEAPAHQPKIKFLMLMKNEALARLRTRYLDATGELVIEEGTREMAQGGLVIEEGTQEAARGDLVVEEGTRKAARGDLVVEKGTRELARGDLATPAGRVAIEAFFRRYLPGELRGPPKVLTAPAGHRFTDSRSGYVSLINLASVAAIEGLVDAPVDPLRFRGNLHLTGLDPWAEFDLVGQVLTGPGGVRLKVTKRIERCAATNVDPGTGLRDMTIPKALMQAYGHFDCGVYAQVLGGGTIAEGDDLAVEPARQPELPFA